MWCHLKWQVRTGSTHQTEICNVLELCAVGECMVLELALTGGNVGGDGGGSTHLLHTVYYLSIICVGRLRLSLNFSKRSTLFIYA